MALVQYVTLILMSLMMISMIFAILPRTLAATERINAVLSTESTVEDVAMPTSLPETAEDSALRTLGADIPEETTVQPAQKRRVPILKMDHVLPLSRIEEGCLERSYLRACAQYDHRPLSDRRVRANRA